MDDEHRTGTIARLEKLGVDVAELRNTDEWLTWLATSRKFRTYSLGNQILIAFQDPEATQVAGYRQWQRMDRQVRKGERSIRILAPLTRKERDPRTGELVPVVFAFKPVSIFDVRQTDGEPLPEMPAWPVAEGCPPGLWDQLVQAVNEGTDVKVIVPMPNQGPKDARGWLDRDLSVLAVRDWSPGTGMLGDAARCGVLLHELGHLFDPGLDASGRQERELVAESAAWLVAQDLGVEMDAEVQAYLAHWDADAGRIMQVAQRIIESADAMRELLADLIVAGTEREEACA